MNKTVKNLLKKVVSERPQDWSRYITPLMFAVKDTPQDSRKLSRFRREIRRITTGELEKEG